MKESNPRTIEYQRPPLIRTRRHSVLNFFAGMICTLMGLIILKVAWELAIISGGDSTYRQKTAGTNYTLGIFGTVIALCFMLGGIEMMRRTFSRRQSRDIFHGAD